MIASGKEPAPGRRPFDERAFNEQQNASASTGNSGNGSTDMRLRTANNRLKVEHSIIEGLRRVLEDLLAATPAIQSIIPGRIRKVRDARGAVKVRVTTPTQTGWKAIALAAGARQELFITTKLTREETEQAIAEALSRQ